MASMINALWHPGGRLSRLTAVHLLGMLVFQPVTNQPNDAVSQPTFLSLVHKDIRFPF